MSQHKAVSHIDKALDALLAARIALNPSTTSGHPMPESGMEAAKRASPAYGP